MTNALLFYNQHRLQSPLPPPLRLLPSPLHNLHHLTTPNLPRPPNRPPLPQPLPKRIHPSHLRTHARTLFPHILPTPLLPTTTPILTRIHIRLPTILLTFERDFLAGLNTEYFSYMFFGVFVLEYDEVFEREGEGGIPADEGGFGAGLVGWEDGAREGDVFEDGTDVGLGEWEFAVNTHKCNVRDVVREANG